jgi:hypothetical protein
VSLSKRQWLGVATESAPGTARTTPTLFHPCKSKFSNKTKMVYLDEERGTRDGNYGRVSTVQMGTGEIQGPWYNDTSPYFLVGFMGLDTASQPNAGTDPTVWLHTLSLVDPNASMPALDCFKSYDYATYLFSYSVVEKVTIKFAAENKLLEADFNTQSQYGTKMATPPSPSYSGLLPFAGYTPAIQVDGTANGDLEDMQLTLNQKITLFYAAAGSRQFVTAYFGERTAKLEGTVRFDSDTFYDYFLTGQDTSHHWNIAFTGPLISSTYHQQVTFDFPIVAFDSMEFETSKDNITTKFNATAMPGTTADSLFTATVQNTVTSYAQ